MSLGDHNHLSSGIGKEKTLIEMSTLPRITIWGGGESRNNEKKRQEKDEWTKKIVFMLTHLQSGIDNETYLISLLRQFSEKKNALDAIRTALGKQSVLNFVRSFYFVLCISKPKFKNSAISRGNSNTLAQIHFSAF